MKTVSFSDQRFSQLDDSEIVSQILSGEKGLYEILLRRNNQKLYRVLRGYVNDPDETEDLMQETYISAFEKLHQFKSASQFSTWLIRIGINKALQRIKKQKSTIIISNEEMPIEYNKTHLSPENLMIRTESKEALETAIGVLEEKYRVTYIMKEIEGMSINEIANCLNISESNVKVRIHRAKQTIKENLYDLSFSNDLFEFGNRKCDELVERVLFLI